MYQEIDIKKLVPSEFNYRKSFDQAALDELAASIKEKGVLQPINVRPLNGKRKGKFEIVAGHRRLQAASAAGLTEMPCMVKELSDEDAMEVQVIENTHREDPNPMDEAHGFKQLLEMGKHTPESLAAKLGRSPGYVLARVKLADLSKPVQAAIASGDLPLGVAKLFIRLRNEGDQKKFLVEVMGDGGSVSVRRAERMLEDYTRNLSGAPFDTAACGACACNSGNQTALFPEIGKDDRCSDRSCFYTKTKQHYTDILKEKEQQGFKVYRQADEVEKLTGYGSGRTVAKIAPTKKEAGYEAECPRMYRSVCAKCTDSHAFYFVEKDSYHGKRIKWGELCLDRKCLKAMQGAGKKEEKAGATEEGDAGGRAANPHTLRVKALDCRNRFLLKALQPMLSSSRPLTMRLALYHLAMKLLGPMLTEERNKFIRQFNPEYKGSFAYGADVPVYRGIAGIPVRKLDDAIFRLIGLAFHLTSSDVMLQMTPEAGVDMAADFAMDEEYLNGKTKDDLSALIEELGLDGSGVSAASKKGDIVKAILAQDLVGKRDSVLAEVCKLDMEHTDEEEEENEEEPAGDYCSRCSLHSDFCTCDNGETPEATPDGEDDTCLICLEKEEDCICEDSCCPPGSCHSCGEEEEACTCEGGHNAPMDETGDEDGEGKPPEAAPETDPTMPEPTKSGRRGRR